MINREEHINKTTGSYLKIDNFSFLNDLIENDFCNGNGCITRLYDVITPDLACKIVDKYRLNFAFGMKLRGMYYQFIKESEDVIYARKYPKSVSYPVDLDYDIKGNKEEIYNFINN